MHEGKPLWYLASPYSHPDAGVMAARFQAACEATGLLLAAGILAWSPIAHSHPVAQRHNLPREWEFWQVIDFALLARCDGLIVLALDGWETSRGVQAEITEAARRNMPISMYYPNTGDLIQPVGAISTGGLG